MYACRGRRQGGVVNSTRLSEPAGSAEPKQRPNLPGSGLGRSSAIGEWWRRAVEWASRRNALDLGQPPPRSPGARCRGGHGRDVCAASRA
jgi:hypothetical protein